MMRRRSRTLAIAGALFGLLAAGCGGSGDLGDRLSNPDGPINEDELDELIERLADDLEAQESESDIESSAPPEPGLPPIDPADFPPIATRTIDAAVFYGTIEWEVQEMVVVDLDADIQPGDAPQGIEITFPTRVYNTGISTAMITNQPIALHWDDPTTGDSFIAGAQLDFREVPAKSFSSGEITVRLSPEDRQLFDDGSAHLLVGRAGLTPAVVPIGSGVELVDRFPVPQDTGGWELSIDGEDDARRAIDDRIVVTDAEVRWTSPEGQALEDGSVLLEITYTIENRGEAQTCSQRSEGAWRLTLPNGDAVSDLRVSERCAPRGVTVTDVLTGFYIPTEDFAGDYELLHARGSGGDDDPADETAITLTDDDGVRPSERND